MRISDWSSDVCSSDLAGKSNFPDVSSSIEEHRHAFDAHQLGPIVLRVVQRRDIHRLLGLKQRFRRDVAVIAVPQRHHAPGLSLLEKLDRKPAERKAHHPVHRVRLSRTHQIGRSEEHTSELQSLMRISYAVFCLKKQHMPPKATLAPLR